jgi:HemY protein
MAPLVDAGQRPSARMCLVMAELEEAEHGATGQVREWLARGSRAPRDPAWIADGVISDVWAPVSPVTGKLDAFVWQAPAERSNAAIEHWTPAPEPIPAAVTPPAIETIEITPLPAEPAETIAPAAIPEPQPILEKAPPQAVTPAPASAPARVAPNPVIFPLTAAPDDPGPDELEKPRASRAG